MNQIDELESRLRAAERRVEWYKSRLNALQKWMMGIPEPYITECSDIIANGEIAEWHKRTLASGEDA